MDSLGQGDEGVRARGDVEAARVGERVLVGLMDDHPEAGGDGEADVLRLRGLQQDSEAWLQLVYRSRHLTTIDTSASPSPPGPVLGPSVVVERVAVAHGGVVVELEVPGREKRGFSLAPEERAGRGAARPREGASPPVEEALDEYLVQRLTHLDPLRLWQTGEGVGCRVLEQGHFRGLIAARALQRLIKALNNGQVGLHVLFRFSLTDRLRRAKNSNSSAMGLSQRVPL
jgi:hypothetical protein